MLTADDVLSVPLRPARLLRAGVGIEAVHRWRDDVIAALRTDDAVEREAELRDVLERVMALMVAVSAFGPRYAMEDVEALIDAVAAAIPPAEWQRREPTGPSSTLEGDPIIRAVELLHAELPVAPSFVEGYSADAVDAWLDSALLTLRRYEGDAGGTIELLAETAEAASPRFPSARGAGAYRTRPVELLVARIAASLRAHEAAALGESPHS